MSLKFTKTLIPEVVLIEPDVFTDQRGFFLETYHRVKYLDGGVDKIFVQDNHSRSKKGALRGMHYQLKHPQDKLVYVISGEIYDVVIDIRRGSPTFKKWEAFVLSEQNKHQLFVPQGFAHGFCVISDTADVMYKCSDFYTNEDEYGVLWSDPEIGIKWPIETPIVTKKDNQHPRFDDIPDDNLPSYL